MTFGPNRKVWGPVALDGRGIDLVFAIKTQQPGGRHRDLRDALAVAV